MASTDQECAPHPHPSPRHAPANSTVCFPLEARAGVYRHNCDEVTPFRFLIWSNLASPLLRQTHGPLLDAKVKKKKQHSEPTRPKLTRLVTARRKMCVLGTSEDHKMPWLFLKPKAEFNPIPTPALSLNHYSPAAFPLRPTDQRFPRQDVDSSSKPEAQPS